MAKYQNKYRSESARATWWNYSWTGAYFITICTKNRNHYFGEIVKIAGTVGIVGDVGTGRDASGTGHPLYLQHNKMILSNSGVLADVFWHEIKNHAKNVELGAFVVMPNHIHGILILTADSDSVAGTGRDVIGTGCDVVGIGRDVAGTGCDVAGTGCDVVGTGHALSLQPPTQNEFENEIPNKSIAQNRFQNQGKNTVSSIIGSYKSAVTKHANRLGLEFGWQKRFHDHIIRNDAEYQRINDYIESNIDNWKEDKFFDDNFL